MGNLGLSQLQNLIGVCECGACRESHIVQGTHGVVGLLLWRSFGPSSGDGTETESLLGGQTGVYLTPPTTGFCFPWNSGATVVWVRQTADRSKMYLYSRSATPQVTIYLNEHNVISHRTFRCSLFMDCLMREQFGKQYHETSIPEGLYLQITWEAENNLRGEGTPEGHLIQTLPQRMDNFKDRSRCSGPCSGGTNCSCA